MADPGEDAASARAIRMKKPSEEGRKETVMTLNYNITDADRQILSHNRAKNPFVRAMIEEFLASGQPIAQIKWQDQYKSINSAAGSIRSIITRNRYPARLISRKSNLYIVRKEDR